MADYSTSTPLSTNTGLVYGLIGVSNTNNPILFDPSSVGDRTLTFTAPTGFSVVGSPLTGTGTISLGFSAGYSLPTTASQTNWDTAFSWGNHAAVGYLTSFTETDPVFSAAPASGIAAGDITNWNTAFGWGDHGAVGYLTSFTETDPVFSAAPASGIAASDITNWNTAYGWGDHAAAGYPDDYEEGTWTPVFGGFGGSESGQSYGDQLGWYTKIGNLVTFGCFIFISTVGTITGSYLVIKGLPFTVGNNIYGGVSVGYYNALNTNVYSMTSWPGSNSTQLFFGKSSGAADSTVLSIPSDIKDGSRMYLAGSYQV